MGRKKLANTTSGYGWPSIVLHWLIAVIVLVEFGIGLYMVTLNYHDLLYVILPELHKSLGLLLLPLIIIRLIWSACHPRPLPEPHIRPLQDGIARSAQLGMHLLLLAVIVMGYLISTAMGDSIYLFNLVEFPATVTSIKNQEQFAGEYHYWFSWALIALASVHALAALKHHFIDRDATLLKMLGKDAADGK